MTPEAVLDIMMRATWTALECAGPLLAIGVGVGLLMGLIQAATSISEPSLTFVPKMVALAMALTAFGAWILERMTALSSEMFTALGRL